MNPIPRWLAPKEDYICALWVGRTRSGKTYAAVFLIWWWLLQGRSVVTNIKLKKFPKRILRKERVGNYHLFENFDTFVPDFKEIRQQEAGHILIVMDEAGQKFNSRNFKAFPQEMRTLLFQHGKYNASLIYIGQTVGMIDKTFRDAAHYVVTHKNLCRDGIAAIFLRLIFVNFHIQFFEEMEEGEVKPRTRAGTRWYHIKEPWKTAYDTYQVLDDVEHIEFEREPFKKPSKIRFVIIGIAVLCFLKFGPFSKPISAKTEEKKTETIKAKPAIKPIIIQGKCIGLEQQGKKWIVDLETTSGEILQMEVNDSKTTDEETLLGMKLSFQSKPAEGFNIKTILEKGESK